MLDYIRKQYNLSFMALVSKAHTIHKENFNPQNIQISKLCSIKTGLCPEDCSYCSQSIHHKESELKSEPLMDVGKIIEKAKKAKSEGATRFCMGAAWRSPPSKAHFARIIDACKQVKSLGLETCMTLGMLSDEQCQDLKKAGLDYYNHNIDTSPEYYSNITKTRTFDDRLKTLNSVANAGLKTCSGGILGLGESREDRISFLNQLSLLKNPPESIPLNRLVPMKGTPLERSPEIDEIEFIRTVAVTRIVFPKSVIRLAAGRESMSHSMQAFCFYCGANSIFTGDELLTAPNCGESLDKILFNKLDLNKNETEA